MSISTGRTRFAVALLGTLSACGGPGETGRIPEAEPAGPTSADIGEHVVHFSAQSTDQLPAEIARAYDIVRSKNRAMLNVSVLRKPDSVPVNAVITVKTRNLAGQLKSVSMRQINDGDAIYYIGELSVANRETLVFDISVTPEGATTPADVRFVRQFFTN